MPSLQALGRIFFFSTVLFPLNVYTSVCLTANRTTLLKEFLKRLKYFIFTLARGKEINLALIRVSFVSLFFYHTVNRNRILCQTICPLNDLKRNKSFPFQNTSTPTVVFQSGASARFLFNARTFWKPGDKQKTKKKERNRFPWKLWFAIYKRKVTESKLLKIETQTQRK